MDDSSEIREKTNIANEADYEKRTFPIPFPISSFLQRVSDQEGGGKSWFHLGEEGKTKNAINHLFRSELTETQTMVENDFPTVAAPRKPFESQNRLPFVLSYDIYIYIYIYTVYLRLQTLVDHNLIAILDLILRPHKVCVAFNYLNRKDMGKKARRSGVPPNVAI